MGRSRQGGRWARGREECGRQHGRSRHGLKGGIATGRRQVAQEARPPRVGVLVQVNRGRRAELRVPGLPVGRVLTEESAPIPATEAPLLLHPCERLVRWAGVGLARRGRVRRQQR
ncbi:P1 family peptidase [Deinococcus aestuarii]|uniref:P1 family peptidase n=1 Tax=Deinococcus aestuarii TaxID=2774531 RepID=UPI001C0D243A|nr:P1 family peptidase [Deinococcus aestuarii]